MGPQRMVHPPDDRSVAQFLAIGDGAGEWPALDALLDELFREGKRLTTTKYGWFHVVAMQRIHGVHPAVQQRARELRVVKKLHGGATVDREVEQLGLDLHQLAQVKRMR